MNERRAGVPLRHPGPVAQPRIVSVPTAVTVLRAELASGARISDELWRLMSRTGCHGASVELAHGSFGTLRYVHPAPGSDSRPAYFSATVEPAGPCFVLGGSATVGTREGQGFAHLHATWLDGEGRVRGGHLLPECTVGDVPIEATMRLLHDAALVSETCSETTMPAFHPEPVRENGRPHAVTSRVLPGVDLHAAVAEIARHAGFGSAVVRASLGSVVGARLRTGDGRVTEADWPATEFAALTGTVANGHVTLAGTAVDRNGDVHSGVLLPGQNPVAVTFELHVEEAGHGG